MREWMHDWILIFHSECKLDISINTTIAVISLEAQLQQDPLLWLIEFKPHHNRIKMPQKFWRNTRYENGQLGTPLMVIYCSCHTNGSLLLSMLLLLEVVPGFDPVEQLVNLYEITSLHVFSAFLCSLRSASSKRQERQQTVKWTHLTFN